MDMTAMNLVTCLGIGAVSGLVAALAGVGGGVIMVPLFTAILGMPQKQAVATSLAAIILTSIAASYRNTGNAFVEWRVALLAGCGGAVVAYIASDWLRSLSNRSLTIGFGALMIVLGTRMLLKELL
ncbi:MAG: hypothetical protein RIS92_2457 [Verrucomicrobiota bacterium]|jgi:uncharacterized membrane protein YfcA